MMALLKFEGKTQSYDIRQEVGSKYRECCTFLLNDRDGRTFQIIVGQYQCNPLWINHEIFSKWLQGKGRQPVTWATLVRVFRDIRMDSLADEICAVLGLGTMQSSGNNTAASSGDVIMPSTDDTPTMMELLKFEGKYDIREQIGTKYSDFGTTLLDCSAAAISALEKQYQHDALSINHETFSRWLQGKGKKPVTWATLIEVLLEIGEGTLADEIGCRTTPSGPRTYLPPLPSCTFTVTMDGGRFGDSSEDGYELEIPQGALPPDVDQLDVTIQPHISNSKKRPLPEGTELVSGVYEIQCTEVRLSKAVSFTCDHCCEVPDKDRASLHVVRARGQGGFEPVDDSQVEIRRSSVVLKLSKLETSCFAVVATVAVRRFVSYCGTAYCLKKEGRMATSVTFHFIVVKDLNVCIKAIEVRYEKCAEEPCRSRSNPKSLQCPHNFRRATKVFESTPIHFASDPEGSKGRRLTVDVGQEGILSNGWKILSKFLPAEIREDDAYHFLPERHPFCELVASWENQDASPGPLKEYVHLQGTTRPRSFLIKHNPEEQLYGDDPTANHDQVSTLENIKFEGQNKQHYISDQIGSKYREFGTFLLEDHNGAKVQEIQRERHEFYWINYEIFSRWLLGEGRQPVSWVTLIGVLRDIGKSTLADDIEAKLADSATPPVDHRTTHSTGAGDALNSEQSPTMMALLKFRGKTRSFDIREEVSIRECCTSLLNDQDAAKFQAIEGQFRGDPLWINHEIFSRWLQGEGRKPVTWATLVGVLGEIGMHSLADEMEDRIGCAITTSGAEKTMGHPKGEMRMNPPTDDMGVRPDLCSDISAHGAGGKELDKNQVESGSRHTVRPSGVEFLSNAIVRVSGSRNNQVVLWEKRGFRMYIPGGALDESEEREIALSTSHSGSFELPVGTFPVSFVYYVEPSGPFRKPVTLEIEHCCNHGLDKLEFAFAESSSKNPPYKFVRLDGGKFPMHSSHGQLEVSHFSLYAILSRRVPLGRGPTTQSPLGANIRKILAQASLQPTTQSPLWGDVGKDRAQASLQPTTQSPSRADDRENRAQASLQPTIQSSVEADGYQYRAHLFHQQRSEKTWHMVLVVTERLAECSQVVQKKFNSWRETMEEKALQFKAECQELSVDLSDDGDTVGDGVWKIFPLSMPPEITRSDIHGLTHKDGGYTPANCEMKIKLQKQDRPQSPIEHVLVLRGLRRPTKLRISIDPEEQLQGDRYDRERRNGLAANTEHITPDTVLTTKHLPKLADILSQISYKWHSIGIQLNLQPGYLETLELESLRSTNRCSKMLIEWLNTAQPCPTVSSLVRALESPDVAGVRQAEEVRRAFNCPI